MVMNRDAYGPGTEPVRLLLRQWEDASVGTVWRRAGDWYTPGVEALAEALTVGASAVPAAARLGRERARAGVGISETMDDVDALYAAIGRGGSPVTTVRALCEGWADGEADFRASPAVTDAESGLATAAYLVARLAELYGSAVADRYALVVLDVVTAGDDPWARAARNAVIGSALEDTFGRGRPMAKVSDGVFAVVVERGPDLGAALAALRDQVSVRARRLKGGNVLRQPPRVWVEALPPTHDFVGDVLEALRR